MVAKVRTNRVFDGRMYGKSRPNSCTVDVRRSLDFELQLGFNDINCDVRQDVPGKYASDVIIQVQHRRIACPTFRPTSTKNPVPFAR